MEEDKVEVEVQTGNNHNIPDKAIEAASLLNQTMSDFQVQIMEADGISVEGVDMQASILAMCFYMCCVASMNMFGMINPGQMDIATEGAKRQLAANFTKRADNGDRTSRLN